MPSMRSVDFFLLGLRLPAASDWTATLVTIQRRTGCPPSRSLPEMTHFSNSLVGAVMSLKP